MGGIADVTPMAVYEGSGSRGPFPFVDGDVAIPFAANTHVHVLRVSALGVATDLELGVHYDLTVTLDSSNQLYSGEVTLRGDQDVLAAASGSTPAEQIIIYRAQPLDQSLALSFNNKFPSQSFDRLHNKVIQIAQEQRADIDRAILAPRGEAGVELERAENRKGKVLAGNADTGEMEFMYVHDVVDGGGRVMVQEFTITADEGDSVFTLEGVHVTEPAAVLVWVGGVRQPSSTYSLTVDGDNTDLTLDAAIEDDDTEMHILVLGSLSLTETEISTQMTPVVQDDIPGALQRLAAGSADLPMRGHFTDKDPGVDIFRWPGRIMGGDAVYDLGSTIGGGTWIQEQGVGNWLPRSATAHWSSTIGGIGVLGSAQSANRYGAGVDGWEFNRAYVAGDKVGRVGKRYRCTTPGTSTLPPTHDPNVSGPANVVYGDGVGWEFEDYAYGAPIGVAAVALYNSRNDGTGVWAGFEFAGRTVPGAGTVFLREQDIVNAAGNDVVGSPYNPFPPGATILNWMVAGYDPRLIGATNPSTAAIVIGTGGDSTWNAGIRFHATGITPGRYAVEYASITDHAQGWFNSSGQIVSRLLSTATNTNNRTTIQFGDGVINFLGVSGVAASVENGGGSGVAADEHYRLIGYEAGHGRVDLKPGGAASLISARIGSKGAGDLEWATNDVTRGILHGVTYHFGFGTTDPVARGHFVEDNAANTDVTDVLVFEHTTSGSPGVGIGVGIKGRAETANNNIEDVLAVRGVLLNVTPGAEQSATDIYNIVNGVLSRVMRLWPNGGVKWARDFDVLTYASIGETINDGVTDATTAIQAALDACRLAGGGVVYFPPGVYRTSLTLYIGDDTVLLGYAATIRCVTLVNDASFPTSAKIKAFVETDDTTYNPRPLLTNYDPTGGNTNIYIYSLDLQAEYQAAMSGGGIHGTMFCNVDGLVCEDMLVTGVSSGIALLACQHFVLRGIRVREFHNGAIDTWTGCKYGTITEFDLDGANDPISTADNRHGIFVTQTPTDTSDPVTRIAEQIVVGPGNIKNMKSSADGSVGVWCGGGETTRPNDRVNRVKLQHVLVEEADIGYLIERGESTEMHFCDAYGTDLHAVEVRAATVGTVDDFRMIGGQFRDCGRSGTAVLWLASLCNNPVIKDIVVRGSGYTYAITVAATVTDASILDCDLTAGSSGDISDAGTRTVVRHLNTSGDVTPAQITADQNNYTPTDLFKADVLRLSTDALRTITGLAGGRKGRMLVIENVGSSDISLVSENAASTGANRFMFASDITIPASGAATLRYDTTASRWRLISLAMPRCIVDEYTADGTWVNRKGAVAVDVELFGAGGGGGGGGRVTSGTAASGGGGGGAGYGVSRRLKPSALTSTVAVTIGTAGAGGAGATVDSTAGGDGAGGANSTFGAYLTAPGGGGGDGGEIAGGSGGGGGAGAVGAGGNATSATAGAAGTAGGVAGGSGAAGNTGINGGGSGGGGSSGAAGNNGGGSASMSGSGGGAGGGISATPAAFAGGAALTFSGLTGNAAGGTAGNAGANGTQGSGGAGQGGSGGGSSILGAGGAGGAGARGGGGGGGGGSALNGSNGGAGGAGGGGYCRVWTYF